MELLNTDIIDRDVELERKNSKIVMPKTDKTALSMTPSRAPKPDQVLETKGVASIPKLDAEANIGDSKKPKAEMVSKPAVYRSERLEGWLDPDSHSYKGLVTRRPFDGKWDKYGEDIDAVLARFDHRLETSTFVPTNADQVQLSQDLTNAINGILQTVQLPEPLSAQICKDACQLGCTVASLCPASRGVTVKLEIFGENSCSRWHMDNFVGRGIISYTGEVGTVFTRDSNVNFWELQHCGCNEHIIHDMQLVEHVSVGDFFFMKGSKFSHSMSGLIHKSPEKRYHKNGRIVNRLVLKVDVEEGTDEAS